MMYDVDYYSWNSFFSYTLILGVYPLRSWNTIFGTSIIKVLDFALNLPKDAFDI